MSLTTGPLTEAVQSNKKAEWSDFLHTVGVVKFPFLALLKEMKKPAQKICNWETDDLDSSGGFEGTFDGADVDSYDSTLRGNLSACAQWIRKSWKVDHFAELTESWAVKNEVAFQKQKAQTRLKLALEQALLSSQDTCVEGAETPNRLRGVGSWLATGGHNTQFPIAPSLRVTSDCTYTEDLADFDESDLEGILRAASLLRNEAVTLDAFVGPALKARMTDFASHDPNASETNVALRTFNQDGRDGQFISSIDVFKFDSGVVRAHMNYNLLRDSASGDRTETVSNGGGYFLDMNRWRIRFMDKINHMDLPNGGGGKRGMYHATPVLVCGVPAGQAMVQPSS